MIEPIILMVALALLLVICLAVLAGLARDVLSGVIQWLKKEIKDGS